MLNIDQLITFWSFSHFEMQARFFMDIIECQLFGNYKRFCIISYYKQ